MSKSSKPAKPKKGKASKPPAQKRKPRKVSIEAKAASEFKSPEEVTDWMAGKRPTPKEQITETQTTLDAIKSANAKKPEVRYSRELAAEILGRLADGETLRQICRDDHMPSDRAVRLWVVDNHDDFAPRYARARDCLLEVWADEIVEISDDGTNDWLERETDKGRILKTLDSEHINRSRLRTENRKWLLSKLKPERYGEKLEVDTPKDGGMAKAAAVTMGMLATLAERK